MAVGCRNLCVQVGRNQEDWSLLEVPMDLTVLVQLLNTIYVRPRSRRTVFESLFCLSFLEQRVKLSPDQFSFHFFEETEIIHKKQ